MSKTGKFLGIPYDWRRPTRWGYDINLHELARRLHLRP